MNNPQIGETVKYLRTGDLFQVEKVTKDFVILNSPDGLTQIMMGTAALDFHFEKVCSGKSLREDLNPKSKFPVLPSDLER